MPNTKVHTEEIETYCQYIRPTPRPHAGPITRFWQKIQNFEELCHQHASRASVIQSDTDNRMDWDPHHSKCRRHTHKPETPTCWYTEQTDQKFCRSKERWRYTNQSGPSSIQHEIPKITHTRAGVHTSMRTKKNVFLMEPKNARFVSTSPGMRWKQSTVTSDCGTCPSSTAALGDDIFTGCFSYPPRVFFQCM